MLAVENDERGPPLGLAEHAEGALDEIYVVRVADAQHIPAVAHEPRRDVLGEGDLGAALDGDVVVIVDPAEVVEAQVAGEGGGLRADPLHQAAVSAYGIDVVVEHLEARPVVAGGEPPLGDGHADAGGDALPERARGGLHPGDEVVLRMTRCVASELAKAADVVQCDRGPAERLVVGIHRLSPGEVEHRPETSGASAIGVPGWPELAACTASMDSVRIVLMARRSMSGSVIARIPLRLSFRVRRAPPGRQANAAER
jgi:hypothetical protein